MEYRLKWYFCGLPNRKPTALKPGSMSKMILQIAVTGKARINPDNPHNFPKSNRENTATSGLMLTFDPTTYGVIRFPSRICTNKKTPITPPAYQYESFVT